jgi:thiol-disulfide isomerase/thioredoxin
MKHAWLIAGTCVVALALVSARQAGSSAVAGATGKQVGPYDEQADAHKDIAAALALAQGDKKNVILDFGGNWCGDCIALAKLFDDPMVRPFREANFHVVPIDVGRWDKNQDLNKLYDNVIEKGVPAIVVLDPSGKVVASTKDATIEAAGKFTAAQVLDYLKTWAPKPR